MGASRLPINRLALCSAPSGNTRGWAAPNGARAARGLKGRGGGKWSPGREERKRLERWLEVPFNSIDGAGSREMVVGVGATLVILMNPSRKRWRQIFPVTARATRSPA